MANLIDVYNHFFEQDDDALSSRIILENGRDLYFYPDIPSEVVNDCISNFQLQNNETLLFLRDTSFWNERNQGTVITDLGITIIPDNEDKDIIYFTWNRLHSVEYKGQCLYIYFYENNELVYSRVNISHLVKDSDSYDYAAEDVFVPLMNAFIEALDQDSSELCEERSEVRQQIYAYYNDEKFQEALTSSLEYRDRYDCVDVDDIIYKCLKVLGRESEAMKYIEKDIAALSQDSSYFPYLTYLKYLILSEEKNELEARKWLNYTYNNIAEDFVSPFGVNVKEDAKLELDGIDYFLLDEGQWEIPYNERKVLMPVNDYSMGLNRENILLMRKDRLGGIEFPIGHPIINQLYIGHPFISTKYIPFENYELEFIEDKVREFCQIVQALGATEVDIKCLNSFSNTGKGSLNQSVSGEVNYKIISAEASGTNKHNNKFLDEISKKISLHQVFHPTAAPHIPEKLVWYENEASWKRLVSQRLQGGLLEHEEKIETQKTQVVSNSELQKLKAEFDAILVDANMEMSQNMKEHFEGHENAILSIKVKFAPMNTFGAQSTTASIGNDNIPIENKLTNNETEYVEELKFVLEDGIIGDRERRSLERLRNRLGISASRAAELEASVSHSSLSEEEQEYLEEYREIIAEGDIRDRDRRMLERLAQRNGISPSRAKEIERLA